MRKLMAVAVAIVLAGLTAQAQASVIAHWSFDSDFTGIDGSGNTINSVNSNTDASANTLAVTAAAAKFGGGGLYSGDDWNYVKLPSNITLNATTGYTIAFWYNNYRNVNNQDMIIMGDNSQTNNFVAVDQAYGGVRVRMSGTSDNFNLTPNEDTGTWHQMVISVSPATGVTLYQDNVSKGTQGGKANLIVNSIADGYNNHAAYNMDWYGMMDEVWMFSGTLTTEERGNLYAMNNIVAPEPATLVLLGLGGVMTLLRRRRK
jgi:hypothetical protein